MVAHSTANTSRPTTHDAAQTQRALNQLGEQARQTFEALSTQWDVVASAPAQVAAAPGQRLVTLRQSLQETLAAMGGLLLEWSLRGGGYGLSIPAAEDAPPPAEATAPTSPRVTPPIQPPAQPQPLQPQPLQPQPLSPPKQKKQPVHVDKARLQAALNSGGFKQLPAAAADALHTIQAHLLKQVSACCGEAADQAAFSDRYLGLLKVTDARAMTGWEALSHKEQVALIECVAAQTRYLQSEVPKALRPPHALGDSAFNRIISSLAQHTSTTRCGVAYGLKLLDTPKGASWYADMTAHLAKLRGLWGDAPAATDAPAFNMEVALDRLRDLLDDAAPPTRIQGLVADMLDKGASPKDPRLCDLLRDHIDALTSPKLKRLRRQLRLHVAKLQADEAQPEPSEADPLAARLRAATTGKRVVLIGGDHIGQALDKLRALLPDAHLDWTPTQSQGGTTQTQNLVAAIGAGTVDVVLVLTRFISHKISLKIVEAARQSEGRTKCILVPDGYGVRKLCAHLAESFALSTEG